MGNVKKYKKYVAITEGGKEYIKYDFDEFDIMLDELEEQGIKVIKMQRILVTEVIENI